MNSILKGFVGKKEGGERLGREKGRERGRERRRERGREKGRERGIEIRARERVAGLSPKFPIVSYY